MPSAKPDQPSRAPDTFLILMGVAVAAFLASHLAPMGYFLDAEAGLKAENFRYAEGAGGAPLFGSEERAGFLTFLFEGLVSGGRASATVGLMAFLLVIGGAFGMIMRTGALERLLKRSILRGDKPNDTLIVALFAAFSLGGAVFGMGEEAIVFALIVVPALVRAGYDSITGLLATYVATQIGFATSWMNPFNVIVAQGIAGLPPLSGLGFRAVMWTVFTLAGAAFVWRYARFVRLSPRKSLAFTSDNRFRDADSDPENTPESGGFGDWAVLIVVALGVVWVAWGVAARGYYLAEIAAQFFATGLAVAAVARILKLGGITLNDLADAFREGAVALAPAAIIVGFAKGAVLLLGGDDPAAPSVLNTLLYHGSIVTAALPAWLSAAGMLAAQCVLNLFVVSGSGQAALTMPLMAPLGELTGVSRQVTILAFQLGDGLTNLIVPASAALMGCLGAARLDWAVWARFVWRPLLGLLAMAVFFVLLAHAIGYQ